MAKEHEYLYSLVAGKPEPYPFKSGERELYQEACRAIWGNVPCDVTWAMNSSLYKEHIKAILDREAAKQILFAHATKHDDGFLAGQIGWIVDAMMEYAQLDPTKNKVGN